METQPGTPEYKQLVERIKEQMGPRYLLHKANRVRRLDGKDYTVKPTRAKFRKVA